MTLDPMLKALLDQLDAQPGPKLWELSAPEARQVFVALMQFVGPQNIPIGAVENTQAPGPLGSIPLRIYTPVGAGPVDMLPTLVFYHGGGFVIGDLDTHDGICRLLANGSGARVIAVDYRLGPEHKFPAAVDDAWAALGWIAANAPALGVDAQRLAVGGDSAGGALSAVMSQLARARGGPKLAFQLLMFPVTDVGADTPTRRTYTEGYFLDRRVLEWFFANYLDSGADLRDPLVSPLHVPDLHGLPPAWLLTAQCDPLHDEGVAYAEKLRAAGVEVAIRDYPGLVHDFIYFVAVLPQAGAALAEAAAALKTALRAG